MHKPNLSNMKFKDWINYIVDPSDTWINAVDPTGNDRDNITIPLGLNVAPPDYRQLTNHSEINTELLFYSFGAKSGVSSGRFKGDMLNNFADNITRVSIKDTLDKTYTMTPLSQEDYYNNIGKYKFVVSPRGNGIDCYRHYETWISKGIPILQRTRFITEKGCLYYGLKIIVK